MVTFHSRNIKKQSIHDQPTLSLMLLCGLLLHGCVKDLGVLNGGKPDSNCVATLCPGLCVKLQLVRQSFRYVGQPVEGDPPPSPQIPQDRNITTALRIRVCMGCLSLSPSLFRTHTHMKPNIQTS